MKTSNVILAGALSLGVLSSIAAVRSVTPVAWNGDPDCWQMRRHNEKMAVVTNGGARVVFIGDSITHFWETSGKAQWNKYFAGGKYKALNLGTSADREIIFVPDQHLGSHIMGLLGRKYILWPGYCPTHAALSAKSIADARAAHPGAPVLVHPECSRDVREAADERLSTGGMCRYARESSSKEIIVGTEVGILHRLQLENPAKTFYPVNDRLVCPNMKKTTLENLAEGLREMKHRVTVPDDTAIRARRAVEAMLAIA